MSCRNTRFLENYFFIFYEIFDRRLNSQHNFVIVPFVCHQCETIIEFDLPVLRGLVDGSRECLERTLWYWIIENNREIRRLSGDYILGGRDNRANAYMSVHVRHFSFLVGIVYE